MARFILSTGEDGLEFMVSGGLTVFIQFFLRLVRPYKCEGNFASSDQFFVC